MQTETQRKHTKSPAEPLLAFFDPLTESEEESDGLAEEAHRVERDLRQGQKEERHREKHRARGKGKRKTKIVEGKGATRRLKHFPMSNTPANSVRPNSHVSWLSLVVTHFRNLSTIGSRKSDTIHNTATSSFPEPSYLKKWTVHSSSTTFKWCQWIGCFVGLFHGQILDECWRRQLWHCGTRHSSEIHCPSFWDKTPDIIELDDNDSPAQESDSKLGMSADPELSKQYCKLYKGKGKPTCILYLSWTIWHTGMWAHQGWGRPTCALCLSWTNWFDIWRCEYARAKANPHALSVCPGQIDLTYSGVSTPGLRQIHMCFLFVLDNWFDTWRCEYARAKADPHALSVCPGQIDLTYGGVSTPGLRQIHMRFLFVLDKLIWHMAVWVRQG